VPIIGSTPQPNDLFKRQVGRTLTTAVDGLLRTDGVLICDRDRNGAGKCAVCSAKPASASYRCPNVNVHASYIDQRGFSAGGCRAVNGISAGPSQNSWRTIIVNEINNGWTIG
jgi:hypothetical protein